jgi:hypothetical protein
MPSFPSSYLAPCLSHHHNSHIHSAHSVGTSGFDGCVGLMISGAVLGAVSALQFLDRGLYV